MRPTPEDHERLYPAIAEALLESIPDDWDEAVLRIEPAGRNRIQLRIFGPSGVPGLRVPDDSLYAPAIELYELFARDARPFSRCDFSLRLDGDRDAWEFNAKYEYPPEHGRGIE